MRHAQRGAISIEFAGLVLVAALVAGVVLTAVASPQVAQTITTAVCRIITLGQGSCELPDLAADRLPSEPCTVAVSGYSVNGRADIVSLGVGGERAVSQEQLSSGQYRVVISDMTSVGAQTGVGFEGEITLEGGAFGDFSGTSFGSSMGASAEIMAEGRTFETYIVGTEEEATQLYQDALYDATVIRATEGTGVFRHALTPLARLAGSAFGREALPEPTSTTHLGGVSTNASAWVTPVVGTAEAAIGGEALMGVTENENGTVTVHTMVASSTHITGDFVTVDGTWPPQAGARLDLTYDGSEILSISVATEVPNTGDLTRSEHSWTLPVENATDRTIVDDLIESHLPWGPNPGIPGNEHVVSDAEAWDTFFAAVDDRGEATRLTYDTSGTNSVQIALGGQLLTGLGIAVGGGVLGDEIREAEYFDGTDWAAWDACRL